MTPTDPEQANQRLVDRFIAEGALWSPDVISAFRATPRHWFLDRVYLFQRHDRTWEEMILRDPGPRELELIYSDRALITHISPKTPETPALAISSSSQPSLMGQMLLDLRPAAGQRILEIGAGTGYNAALLGHLAGAGQVISVEVDKEVLSEAWDHLRRVPDRHVELKHADGREGFADAAPYDRILATAATAELEPAWLEQLAPGGLLVAPLALAPGLAFTVRGTVRAGVFVGRLTRAAYFMPLRAEGETGREEEPLTPLPSNLESAPAPWVGWFEGGGPRLGWPRFIQSLAFHGWVRGLEVKYQTLATGETAYAIRKGEARCWLGGSAWHFTGDAGRELGQRLWHSYLKAGGPWPTEYRLTTAATGEPRSSSGTGIVRRSARGWQVWEVRKIRDRIGWS